MAGQGTKQKDIKQADRRKSTLLELDRIKKRLQQLQIRITEVSFEQVNNKMHNIYTIQVEQIHSHVLKE